MFMDYIFSKLENLKNEWNLIILIHYYQYPDIQDIPDVMGEGLALVSHERMFAIR